MAYSGSFSGSFGSDRYAGGAYSDSDSRQRKADLDLQARELQVQEAKASTVDAQRKRSEYTLARNEFSVAADEVKSGEYTPGSAAVSYVNDTANIVSLVNAGELDKAYTAYQKLDGMASEGHDTFLRRTSLQPSNDFEKMVQTGSQMMLTRAYNQVQVNLPGQDTPVTVGDLFRDGTGYKKYRQDKLLRENYDPMVVKAYNATTDVKDASGRVTSEDPDLYTQGIMRSIVDPGANEEGGGSFQRKEFALYMAKDMKAMREELGDDGVRMLVNYVNQYSLGKEGADGTAIDMADSVRDWVFAQSQAGVGAGGVDKTQYVGKALRQFNRTLERLSTDPNQKFTRPSDSARRLAMKMMRITTEESDVPIDFDDLRVRDTLDTIVNTVASADVMGIPLLCDAHAEGAPFRKAVKDAVEAAVTNRRVPDDNLFSNITAAHQLVTGLFTQGLAEVNRPVSNDPRVNRADPGAAAAVMKHTTGSPMWDNALARMIGSLQKDYVLPSVYRGVRADIVLGNLAKGNPETLTKVTEQWAQDIASTIGLSEQASAAVADAVMSQMVRHDNRTGRTSLQPVNLQDTITRLAFDRTVDKNVARELGRALKAHDLVGEKTFNQWESGHGYTRMLLDDTVGLGLRNPQAVNAALGATRLKATKLLEMGKPEAVESLYRALGRTGAPYRWTGAVILEDGSRAFSRDGRWYQMMDDGKLTEVHKETIARSIPEITREGLRDLDSVSFEVKKGEAGIQVGLGFLPAITFGEFSRDPEGFISKMRMLKDLQSRGLERVKARVKDKPADEE